MIKLNCGNKWNMEFLERVITLNKIYEGNHIRVNELYGNPIDPILSGVRPDARLPFIDDYMLGKFIDKANRNNIEINITLNKSCLGLIEDLNFNKLQARIKWYESKGVKRFTLFSPNLLRNLDIKTAEISTIHNNSNINYLYGISHYRNNIDKICLPIYMNRDFNKIKKCVDILPNPELIVNEFCVAYRNICYYRTECYNIQSHNQNIEYPFKQCSEYRDKHPLSWLKAPFILPQWLSTYEQIFNIHHFKLTGRTHSDKSLLNIIEIYLSMQYEGPIHKLWGEGLPFQDLTNEKPILAEELDSMAFLYAMMMKKYTCENSICDVDCKFCSNILHEYRRLNGKIGKKKVTGHKNKKVR